MNAVKLVYKDCVPLVDELDEKTLAQKIYDIATGLGIQPKALFTAMYQALIGKNQGPRLASFMKIIGRDKLTEILKVY